MFDIQDTWLLSNTYPAAPIFESESMFIVCLCIIVHLLLVLKYFVESPVLKRKLMDACAYIHVP